MIARKTLRIILAFAFLFLLVSVFVGCGTKSAPAQSAEEPPEPTPEPTPAVLQIGSLTVPAETERLSLEGSDATLEELLSVSAELKNLKELSLGVTGARLDQLRAVEAAFPQAEVSWKAAVLGTEVDSRDEFLDLSEATDEDLEEILSALAVLPELRTLRLAPEEGLTALSFDTLSAIAAAAPEAALECRFELFGQTADWTTEKLKYKKVAIGDEGVDLFREALPYLRALTLLRFEDCSIEDNDKMDALRSDFPDTNVVWSIRIGGFNFMTDTTLINAGLVLTKENVTLLRYMHDVLYFDIGHYKALTDIECVRNWPKLQVVIITLTNIRDLSPLEDCPDLEFLECHGTPIDDISVLADEDKLEYLNIANMPNLKDLTPLYGLKQLKLVRICGSTYTNIRQTDVDALKEALPDTNVSDYGGDPNSSGGWRFNANGGYTERYKLLREQMRYDLINWQLMLSNSPSGEED